METIIYYFTGTGNSLAFARYVAENLDGETKIISIADCMAEDEIDISGKVVGIVFPLYYQTAPVIVQKFIHKLKGNENTYLFAAVTCGYRVGISLNTVASLLSENGMELSVGKLIKMPYNFIIGLKATSEEKTEKLLNAAQVKARELALLVNTRSKGKIDRAIIKHIHPYSKYSLVQLEAALRDEAKNFHVAEPCVGCGLCEKICPVNNILLQTGKPVWQDKCEQCLACINYCPKQAVEYGTATKHKRRYKNPMVSIKQDGKLG